MAWFSVSTVLSALFLAYVGHSIYSLVSIFFPPGCASPAKFCMRSSLSSRPPLKLVIGTTARANLHHLSDLTVVERLIPFDYESAHFSRNLSIPLPRSTRRNGTLHVYAFAFPYTDANSWERDAEGPLSMMAYMRLTEYLVPPAPPINLLQDADKPRPPLSDKPVTHVAKRLRLLLLTDPLHLPTKELPPDIGMLIRYHKSDVYVPPLRFDKFGSRLHDFYPLNKTEENFTLYLEYTPSSLGYLRLAQQFQGAMETMAQLGFSPKDLDEVKGIFSDTNIWLLAVTMFVASVHLLFDFLAFKNDIAYWKARKSTVGLSSRTTLWRAFSQIIVFLYLLEEKSSLLVTVPSAIGTLIEMWKVKKAFKISLSRTAPFISFGALSAQEEATQKHDIESMRYLGYVMYPVCAGGAVYSLLYVPHKSWYSWTIHSLVYGVYSFGFLLMLPQLFVNYRLKSVAHLPWRAFMYKAFNTFIDDLFAFIITMPTAHRMACFRDDIVFLIYLYQRWLYPVDKTRLDAGGEFEVDVTPEDKKTK